MTSPERIAAAVALLLPLAVLTGCASPKLPAELPHYPCRDGKGGWVECDVHDWLSQQGARRG